MSVAGVTEAYRAKEAVRMATQFGNSSIHMSAHSPAYTNGVPGVNAQVGPGHYKQPAGSYEGYVDTRANRNFQERRDLSNIAAWKGNCSACSAGTR